MKRINRKAAMQSWLMDDADINRNDNWMRRYSRDLKLEYLLSEGENIENDPLKATSFRKSNHFRDVISH